MGASTTAQATVTRPMGSEGTRPTSPAAMDLTAAITITADRVATATVARVADAEVPRYQMRLIMTALMIAPQTAADAALIRTTAARRARQSRSPSSSIYAREINAITIAGAMLLKGTGVRSNTAVSNRTMTATKRLAASKAVGQRG